MARAADIRPLPGSGPDPGQCMLALRGVRKVYGATVAVDGLTLALAASAVHAIVGENGAGKSTAARIAAGVVHPTQGHVEFEGRRVAFGSAREAEALGIVFIPQELQLYDSLSVAENMFVGRPRPRARGPFIVGRRMRQRAREQLARLGVAREADQLRWSRHPDTKKPGGVPGALDGGAEQAS